MADAISGAASSGNAYRDYLKDYARYGSSDVDPTQTTWNATFEDEDKQLVTADDFLTLMVAQLRNQDFMNPVDDTQYVTQLAQFATMSQMQEMASNMKSNYALSLVGQNVTAAKFNVNGSLTKETGIITKISLVEDSYEVTVNGQKFKLSEIMELNTPGTSSSNGSASNGNTTSTPDPQKAAYLVSLIGKKVTVVQPGLDSDSAGSSDTIEGVVQKISTTNGKYQLMIDDVWYSLNNVTGVEPDDTLL
ncbi:MAG: hypothetical protein HFG20_06390 [Anaerotruncus sp.]|nr:hypothetical protein [Anaerotruncus sp.]